MSASPAATSVRRRASGAERRALGDHAVLGRRHAEDVDALGVEDLQALGRVEAGVVQQRRGAADPRCDEHVARGLRPAARGRAPDEVAGAGIEPVLGLKPLAGKVALSVDDPLRLAGRAARERDQARVGRLELDRRRGLAAANSDSSGIVSTVARGPRGGELGRVALVGDDQPRPRLRRGAGAGPWRGAARCTAARRRRSESRRPSSAPTRAGCRSASSRRRRLRTPGAEQRAGEPGAAVSHLAEATTRGARRRGPARPARGRPGGGIDDSHERSSWPRQSATIAPDDVLERRSVAAPAGDGVLRRRAADARRGRRAGAPRAPTTARRCAPRRGASGSAR